MTKYKNNFMEKAIIETPKELIWKKRKYKVINQVIEVEHCFEYCVICNRIVLKMPMLCIDKGKILQGIKEMCASMSDHETKTYLAGWADAGCKAYEIMIMQSLQNPFLSNIMKEVNDNANAIRHKSMSL